MKTKVTYNTGGLSSQCEELAFLLLLCERSVKRDKFMAYMYTVYTTTQRPNLTKLNVTLAM